MNGTVCPYEPPWHNHDDPCRGGWQVHHWVYESQEDHNPRLILLGFQASTKKKKKNPFKQMMHDMQNNDILDILYTKK